MSSLQLIDKLTRNHIFNSRYWKQQCFALNAQSLIDKAIKIRYIGGLYSGSKKPTNYLCLLYKMLQMNLSRDIAVQYLKINQYKYFIALTLLYLRLILKHNQVYQILEPYLNDNRKLVARNNMGKYNIIYMDEFIQLLLHEQIIFNITLPYLTKRIILEDQNVLPIRPTILEEELENMEKQYHSFNNSKENTTTLKIQQGGNQNKILEEQIQQQCQSK